MQSLPHIPDRAAAGRPLPPAVAEDLVRRARAGDRDAFESLLVAAMPMLAGTARRLLRDPYAAEEVLAEALFRAWRRIGSFRGDAGFGTWLHRIVCRAAVDRFRVQARERRRRDALGARPGPVPSKQHGALERLAQGEETERIRALVDGLPERQRLVIVLHVWEHVPLKETASLLGLAYATAKSHLCHARQAVRRMLESAP